MEHFIQRRDVVWLCALCPLLELPLLVWRVEIQVLSSIDDAIVHKHGTELIELLVPANNARSQQ